MSLSSSASSLKHRQLSHLNSQLAQLQANVADFHELISVTALQLTYIKKLGLMHGGLFMASHKVFENELINRQHNRDQEISDNENSDVKEAYEGEGEEEDE